MIKKFLISSCLLLSLVMFSQEGTSSPYSFYGIGEARFNGNVESRSMGGIAMIPDSTRINFQNPAGYGNLKWTNFTVAGSTSSTKQKSGTSSGTAKRTTLDYLALAVPLGKFGAGFGLIPYSSVGYKIENIYEDGSQNSKRFNGWGGMNRVFLGAGYRILPNLSIGATGYYNFGKIHTNSVEFIPYVPIGSRELNVTDLTGLNLNFGLMYQYKLKDKIMLFSSLTYTPKSILVSNNDRTISTVTINSDFDYSDVDSYDTVTTKTDLQLPQKWALGLGFGDAKKWVFGAEIALQDIGKLYNTYNTSDNVTYSKYQRYGFGGYFTPSTKPFASYFKRITYRGGFVYEKTGLIVNSTPINDVGMTLGLGLPITGSLSNFNVGLEFGKKGTTTNNLVQENYFILNLGFSLNDKWFVKNKYR
ncbi:hypothetical protein [Flavobacterium sp.]|uniref:hypothetical protein n=1 Tax=Flavobacterium sp. TaxID=239 RepID=UPI00286D9D65|nr:hypothetical protein [Flavobacterium sp.]